MISALEIAKRIKAVDDSYREPTKEQIPIIEAPKTRPLIMAFLLLFLSLRKKETVIGIIGKTHGVSSPARPDRKARINKPQLLSLSVSDFSPLNVLAMQGDLSL